MSDASSLFLGIEIGGTKLQLGVGRGDGRIVELVRSDVDRSRGAAGIRDQIAAAVEGLKDRHGPIAAIGIGFGGPIDRERRRAIKSHQIDGWDDFPLADWAVETLDVAHVDIHNDADTAALGEARFGAGVGKSPVLYVTIGSGIGGGLVIDGRIYRGNGAGAIEIGHLWMDEDGPPVILEDLASGWGIAREAVRWLDARRPEAGDRSWSDTPSIVAAARSGDPYAREFLALTTRRFAKGLAHAITLLAPERVILGGGVALIGEDYWFGPIRDELALRVFKPLRGTYDVVPAALGEDVVVHGALAMASDLRLRHGVR